MITNRTAWTVRAALAAVLVAAGVTWSGPAGAEPAGAFTNNCPPPPSPEPPDPTPAPTPGPQDCTPRSEQAIHGVHKIRFQASATSTGERLKQVDLFLEPDEPDLPPLNNPVLRQVYGAYGDSPQSADFMFEWDTNVRTPHNGRYKLRIEVVTQTITGSLSAPANVATRSDIRVDNRPVMPRKPSVVSATLKGVSIKWDAAPEPDVLFYTLYRARTDSSSETPDDEDFEVLLQTAETQVFDQTDEPGAYWYKLRVTRRSVVTPEKGISSPLSGRSNDAGVVPRPTPAPGESAAPAGRSTPRPVLRPRPLPRLSARPAPVPDAPFSTVLDYGDDEGLYLEDEEGSDDLASPEDAEAERREEAAEARRRALPTAIGVFMVSAWAVLTRSRVVA